MMLSASFSEMEGRCELAVTRAVVASFSRDASVMVVGGWVVWLDFIQAEVECAKRGVRRRKGGPGLDRHRCNITAFMSQARDTSLFSSSPSLCSSNIFISNYTFTHPLTLLSITTPSSSHGSLITLIAARSSTMRLVVSHDSKSSPPAYK